MKGGIFEKEQNKNSNIHPKRYSTIKAWTLSQPILINILPKQAIPQQCRTITDFGIVSTVNSIALMKSRGKSSCALCMQ